MFIIYLVKFSFLFFLFATDCVFSANKNYQNVTKLEVSLNRSRSHVIRCKLKGGAGQGRGGGDAGNSNVSQNKWQRFNLKVPRR